MYSFKRFTGVFRAPERGGHLFSGGAGPTHRTSLLTRTNDDAWLNRLTIGQVVLGFLRFRQTVLWTENPPSHWRFLSLRELTALERWQEDHDAGRLSTELFVAAVEALTGDRARNKAFAGFGTFGSVLPRPPRNTLSRQLGLSPSQEREARAIYTQLHEEIRRGQSQAQAAIRDKLDADDQAVSAALRNERPSVPARRADRIFGRLVNGLKLSYEHQAAIVLELALLRSQVEKEHQRARSGFISLLSAEQWDALQSIENLATGPED